MESGRNHPTSFEEQMRLLMLHNPPQQHQQAPIQHPTHPSMVHHQTRPPPGFNMAPHMRHQSQESHQVNMPMSPHMRHQLPESRQIDMPSDRPQGFTHFLQHHHVNQVPNQGHDNGMRPHRVMDPSQYQRPRPNQRQFAPHQPNRGLYQSQPQQPYLNYQQQFEKQWQYLNQVSTHEIAKVEMTESEVSLKDAFRVRLQHIFENLKSPDSENPLPHVILQSFGSLSSGFATSGSDMDLAIVTASDHDLDQRFSSHENGLPRVLEKELLKHGIGARLLTRTRVPIIKICEQPSDDLITALREARTKWDDLSDEEKYANPKAPSDDTHPKKDTGDAQPEPATGASQIDGSGKNAHVSSNQKDVNDVSSLVASTEALKIDNQKSAQNVQGNGHSHQTQENGTAPHDKQANRQKTEKTWRREKTVGPLDFPKDGVGIQCDINFFNPLGIHNTQMLRCYSKCDPRVRPMVLFIKSWAKRRKINSSYSGTLSSYGYVLMVLHYLVNIARPPVLPNLQHEAEAINMPSLAIDGHEVRFFDDESAIEDRVRQGHGSTNQEPLGMLLVGFFKYYAMRDNGFFWTRDVLSLRTRGGTLTKDEKGWTGAKTEVSDHKEVRHRYLFAIEDPFETTHNVARTVTHHGIVTIRDEFRRAWRILSAVGRGNAPEGSLFDEVIEAEEQPPPAAAVSRPPPAVNKVQEYGQQFPTLGGPSATTAPTKPTSSHQPFQAPAMPRAMAPVPGVASIPVPEQSVTQPPQTTNAAPAPVTSRPKGRKQKFVPLY